MSSIENLIIELEDDYKQTNTQLKRLLQVIRTATIDTNTRRRTKDGSKKGYRVSA